MHALFEQLFEVVPDAMILVDAAGRVVRANQGAHRLFGYADRDLLGAPVDTLLPEGARERHQAHRRAYMAQPRIRPMGAPGQTLHGRRRNGSVFPVEIALSPLQTEDGPCCLASIRDIAESQRERQAMARASYDQLVARVGELAMRAVDEDSVVSLLPREIAEALKVDAVAILSSARDGRPARVLASCGIAALAPADLCQLLGGNRHGSGEALLWEDAAPGSDPASAAVLRAAGFRSGLFLPLSRREGRLGCLVVLSRSTARLDPDARNCLGSVASLLSAFLQRQRSEEQLAHVQRLEAIGQLTGGIAHDFNNLLTVISGNLQLIELLPAGSDKLPTLLRHAQHAVDSAARLTGKLLAFARRQHLRPQWIDTGALLDDVAALLRRTLGETLHLEVQAAPGLPPLYADRTQLETALLNLALNARDAMPGGGWLRIEAALRRLTPAEAEPRQVAPGEFLSLTVVDSGIGMEEEVLAHIFEPFYTTKPPGEGNGLGLSMVYGFVRQTGGTARVESRPGEGTRIELLLPVGRSSPSAGAIGADAGEPESGDSPRGSEHLLVVEDDPAVREVTVAFLHSLGYTVEALSDAETALSRLASGARCDLVLSDVVLGGGLSGVELAEALQQRQPQLPVLLVSGYEHESQRRLGLGAQRFELLQKPYRRDHLARLLRMLLDRLPTATGPSQ